MLRSRILSTGMYVPPLRVTNHDLSKLMDTSDEWIRQRTGIEQRFWVEGNESTSDLALKASELAIERAGIQKSEIEMIILATLSPDHEFPGTACFLQKKLGIPGIPALDVRQQCTGFIYSMAIADQFIRNGVYRNALIVGAEIHSKGLEKSDRGRDVTVLFGDGAGAVVLGAVEVKDPKKDSFLLSTHLHADGTFAEELWTPAPGTGNSKDRVGASELEQGLHWPRMNGKTVFMHAVKRMPEALNEGLKANKLSPADIDLFVFHQANLRINDMIAKQFGIPEEKVFNTIQKFANTTAATIPIGLDEAVRAGKLKKGMLVASAAFGSGFTWGSAIYRF
ncbi:MAG: ketoacyl-ACP synthase III [Bdellovibrionales bacterium]|nr:ketoacyl-ACP synthase III [Bdellovibrionales bacterium]